MKKKFFTVLLTLLLVVTLANAQVSNKADVVILLDNSGTMLPYYDEINSKVLTEICDNFVRIGDTFHLLSFNEKPITEIAQPVKTEADIYKIISRFNLLYPLGPYTDFPEALLYAQQYMAALDVYSQKVLVIISDGLLNPAETSTFYGKAPDEINNVIDNTITTLKSEGVHIYYIKAPFPENLNLKNLDNQVTTTAKDGPNSDETYFEYGTTLENLPAVETSKLTPDENSGYNSDSFIGPILSMPEISSKKDLGNKKLQFTLPVTIKNTSDKDIKLELKKILVNEKNVLSESVFIKIKANKAKKINAKISMPENTELGQQQLYAECVFADNVRTRPQYLDFFVNFKSGKNIFFNLSSVSIAIIIIILVLIAIGILLFILINAANKHKDEEERRKNIQNTDSGSYAESLSAAKGMNGADLSLSGKTKSKDNTLSLSGMSEQRDNNLTLGKKKSESTMQSDTSNVDTLNSYKGGSTLSVGNRKQENILEIKGDKYNTSNGSGLNTSESAKKSFAGSNKMSMPEFKQSESSLRLPSLDSMKNKKYVEAASATDPIEAKTDKDIVLELFVEGQNKNIGRRNIHKMAPGSRRSIGGGLSSFSIFLVQVPSSIAEVRYDGENCSLAILQPEYFPEATSSVIENCINQPVIVQAQNGYRMTIKMIEYENKTDKLNNLLLSIVDDNNKQRYKNLMEDNDNK